MSKIVGSQAVPSLIWFSALAGGPAAAAANMFCDSCAALTAKETGGAGDLEGVEEVAQIVRGTALHPTSILTGAAEQQMKAAPNDIIRANGYAQK